MKKKKKMKMKKKKRDVVDLTVLWNELDEIEESLVAIEMVLAENKNFLDPVVVKRYSEKEWWDIFCSGAKVYSELNNIRTAVRNIKRNSGIYKEAQKFI